jgi:broad specificity phosphatase PhoE
MNLYFVRHGETDWNREGRLQGQQDIPLNPLGAKQAARVGSHLAQLAGSRLTSLPFFVSPLIRTRQTADAICAALGLPSGAYSIEGTLREISFGAWEGKTWPEVTALDPQGAAARNRDKWGFAPPGGESYADVRVRIRPFLQRLREDCCIIAHGGIARAMLVELAGVSTADAVARDIWQGKVLHFTGGEAHWRPHAGHETDQG